MNHLKILRNLCLGLAVVSVAIATWIWWRLTPVDQLERVLLHQTHPDWSSSSYGIGYIRLAFRLALVGHGLLFSYILLARLGRKGRSWDR